MILTEDQLHQYRTEGYTVVEDFFTHREVEALRRELNRFVEQGLLRNVATQGDGATKSTTQANLQIIPIFPHSALYRAAPFHPKMRAAVTQIIGEPAIMHLDQIFLKPAHHGRGTDWHQDNHYFKISDPMMGLGTWTALHDATIANGTMHVAPGMWREPLEHTRDPFSDHHLHCHVPEEKVVPVEIDAGSVLFFCYGTPHCTRANTTDRDRAGLAMHFLRADYAPEELVQPDRRERPYINGPHYTAGIREYGLDLDEAWQTEVDNVLAERAHA
jgi:ectoine hydroxylase-related dioxygenase (phytanoyl-CoA dioxygenase family)